MNIKMSVKIAMARHDMTVRELAEKMEVSRTRVYEIIKQPAPLITTVQKVANAFGMRVSDFIALGESEELKKEEIKKQGFSYAMGILRNRFLNFNEGYFWYRMRYIEETESNVSLSIQAAKKVDTVNLFFLVMEESS